MSRLQTKRIVRIKLSNRKEIISSVIAGLNAEVTAANDLWKTLETKTQGTIAGAGILLAGLLTFIKDKTEINQIERVFVFFSLVMLILCFILALRALLVISTIGPPQGKWRKDRLEPLLKIKAEDELGERIIRHMMSEAIEWQKCLDSVSKAYFEKTKYLLLSQKFLVVSIGLVCGSVLIRILNIK